MLNFYLLGRDGSKKRLTLEETRKFLSEHQIDEAITAKQNDPLECVEYMITGGGRIVYTN